MKFEIGDLIIYGETGVCRVDAIEDKPFLGEITKCYKLQPIYQSCVITTPIDNNNVYMRPIISKEEAEAIIASVSQVKPMELPVSAPRTAAENYDKIIKTHDCQQLLTFAVSVYHKRKNLLEQKKKLPAIDERYMKKAEDLLFGELAAALNIEKAEMHSRIQEEVTI